MERRSRPDLCQLLFEQEATRSFDSCLEARPTKPLERFLAKIRRNEARPALKTKGDLQLCPELVRQLRPRPYFRLSPSKPSRPLAFSFEHSGVFREIDVGKALVASRMQMRSRTPALRRV